jgi:hypothetical protein
MSLDDAQQAKEVSSPRPFLVVEWNTDLQNLLQDLETHGRITLQQDEGSETMDAANDPTPILPSIEDDNLVQMVTS